MTSFWTDWRRHVILISFYFSDTKDLGEIRVWFSFNRDAKYKCRETIATVKIAHYILETIEAEDIQCVRKT